MYFPSSRRTTWPINKPPFEYTQRFGVNRRHPLAEGLVGCWPLNELAGNIAYDISGYNNHCILTSGARWGENSLDLSPVGNFYAQGPADSPGDGATEITVFSIFRQTNTTNAGLFSKRVHTEGSSLSWQMSRYLLVINMNFYIDGDTNSQAVGTTTVEDGWNTAGGTWKSGEGATAFLNGTPDGSKGIVRSGAIRVTTSPIFIGKFHSDAFVFDGYIALTLLYNKKLSEDEMFWLHREPVAMLNHEQVPTFFSLPAIGAASAPTGTIYGPLVGPLGGPV